MQNYVKTSQHFTDKKARELKKNLSSKYFIANANELLYARIQDILR